MNNRLKTRKIAMTYRSPGNPNSLPGSLLIPKIKAARGRGELFIYHPVNEIYSQRFSKFFNQIPDPLAIHRNIEDMTGMKTEYVEVDSVEHDTHLGDMPYYSTVEKFGDEIYEGIPLHLSIADAFISGNNCDLIIPRDFLFGWKKLKKDAFKMNNIDPEYENLVRKEILFRSFRDTNYRLTYNLKESNYKELEAGRKFVVPVETNIDDIITRTYFAYRPFSDGEVTYNFPLRDVEEFEPGESFNVGKKLHNEMSWLKKKIDDNGLKVSKIYYSSVIIEDKKPMTPLCMKGGIVKLSDENGKEYEPIYIGDDINIEYFGTLTNSHNVKITKTYPRKKTSPVQKENLSKTPLYIA